MIIVSSVNLKCLCLLRIHSAGSQLKCSRSNCKTKRIAWYVCYWGSGVKLWRCDRYSLLKKNSCGGDCNQFKDERLQEKNQTLYTFVPMQMTSVIIEVSPCCDQGVNSHRSCKKSIFAVFLYKKLIFGRFDQTTVEHTRFNLKIHRRLPKLFIWRHIITEGKHNLLNLIDLNLKNDIFLIIKEILKTENEITKHVKIWCYTIILLRVFF